jgi:hypothetical protein
LRRWPRQALVFDLSHDFVLPWVCIGGDDSRYGVNGRSLVILLAR